MDAAPSVDLVWTQDAGGDSCIGQSELEAKVRSALGPAPVPAQEGRGEAFVRGSVGRGPLGRGWFAVVEVRLGHAATLRRELTLDAPDCRQFDEAIVLVVALLLDAAVSSPPPLTIARSVPTISVSLGPDIAVAWGMLPGLSFGFGVVSEAEIGALWPIVLAAHEWPASRATDGVYGGDLGAFTFGAALCPAVLSLGVWQIFGCAGASGGGVTARGFNLDVPRPSVNPYVQIDTQVGLRVRVAPHLTARLGLGAGVPLIHDTYQFHQADGSAESVFFTSDVVAVGQVAIELRAPR
jgi:hypothetical protein